MVGAVGNVGAEVAVAVAVVRDGGEDFSFSASGFFFFLGPSRGESAGSVGRSRRGWLGMWIGRVRLWVCVFSLLLLSFSYMVLFRFQVFLLG